MKDPELLIQRPDGSTEVKRIDRRVFVIGRSSECDIRIPGRQTSRRHAEIRFENGAAQIVDLGSINGTLLNMASVSFASLANGDLITIGETSMRFRIPDLSSTSSSLGSSSPRINVQMIISGASKPHSAADNLEIVKSTFLSAEELSEGSSMPMIMSTIGLRIMSDVVGLIRQTTDERVLIDRILAHIFELTDADRGAVLMRSAHSDRMIPVSTKCSPEAEAHGSKIVISQTVIDHVL
jgi:pSer/pThr/pTyr-binding forkhead associated (FHA) protein